MKIRVVVLDFDNCIALNENGEGSEEIKDSAWYSVFAEYPADMLEYLLNEARIEIAGGKGDRKDIVKKILVHYGFSKTEIPDEIIKRCDHFDKIVQNGIKQIEIPAAVKNALAKISTHFPLYINTATPEEAILETLKALDLISFFKKIYGRPGTKISNLQNIIIDELIYPQEALFVDDQPSGYKAARKAGCQFVGIRTKRNTEWHNPQPFIVINSLAELPKILKI